VWGQPPGCPVEQRSTRFWPTTAVAEHCPPHNRGPALSEVERAAIATWFVAIFTIARATPLVPTFSAI